MQQKGDLFLRKLFFSLLLILVYLVGRGVPVPWVIPAEHQDLFAMDLSSMIGDMLGKDPSGGSVLALGLGPYMSTMIFVQIASSLYSKNKSKKPPKKVIRRISISIAMVMAAIQGFVETAKMELRPDYYAGIPTSRILTVITLMAGVAVVIFLAETNTEKGLGGMSAFILVNVLTNARKSMALLVMQMLEDKDQGLLMLMGLLGVGILLIVQAIVFDYAEIRLKIYRIMIHNDLSDIGYLPIKLNPSGSMPVMFAMTFFLIPYYLLAGLQLLFPENRIIALIVDNFQMSEVPGVIFYIFVIIFLNFAFASVFIDPKELAKNFREGGDCLVGVQPGEPTEKAIKYHLRFCCGVSAATQCVLVGVPLLRGAITHSQSKLNSMPMTMMILSGITLSVVREAQVLMEFRDYKKFL